MQRVVSDKDGTTWTCIQAFTGLSDQAELQEAAQVKGQDNTYWVVCTPSGGAQSVRLKLSGDVDGFHWQVAQSVARSVLTIHLSQHRFASWLNSGVLLLRFQG